MRPTKTDSGDDMTIETDSYQVADTFFGAPYIDLDEQHTDPYPHRRIHGGFNGTDTRFTFYFPPVEEYQGRMFHPLEGAHAGHEDAFAGMMGQMMGGLPMIARFGGYMVESNSGHIGDNIDPKGGDDPTIYGHRASVESARFSKFVAAQIYGEAPHHSYVWGGSGGGRRSPLCLEYGNGVYDGALPFMGGGNIDVYGTRSRVRSEQPIAFASMFNVQRLLGDRLESVVDAMQPGGSGNPFEGLSVHERDELQSLYRQGFPRGDEYMILKPMGQIWLWTSTADMLQTDDADYFEAFWTNPGYVGHDEPHHVLDDLIDTTASVSRVVTAQDLMDDDTFAGPEFDAIRPMTMIMASMGGGFDLPIAIEVKGLGEGYRLGAGVRILTGPAAGRQLYCLGYGQDVLFCDGHGEANLERFKGVSVGDEVRVDNRAFLAFCYYARHHISGDVLYDYARLGGKPVYPQHEVPLQSPLMGVPYSGQYEGRLLWVHHTHDSSLWPPQGVIYEQAVREAQGPDRAAERFRLRWTENAEHIPPFMLASPPNRSTTTWLIDYMPIIEQSLLDLCAWVEDGVEPAGTNYRFEDGRVLLPATAAERGGIQPVVSVTANGTDRAHVGVGETVALEVRAEVPPNAGTLIAVEWDFDGSGTFPFRHDDIDGTQSSVKLNATHVYAERGTYFATARVFSHRTGELNATSCRIENVASARVVVA
jgi:hypothetical protein